MLGRATAKRKRRGKPSSHNRPAGEFRKTFDWPETSRFSWLQLPGSDVCNLGAAAFAIRGALSNLGAWSFVLQSQRTLSGLAQLTGNQPRLPGVCLNDLRLFGPCQMVSAIGFALARGDVDRYSVRLVFAGSRSQPSTAGFIGLYHDRTG